MPTNQPPAEVFPPGEHLSEELEARGLSQADFAVITGRTPATINQILSGKRTITPELARDIGAALGTSPDLWLGLEQMWQVSQLDERPDIAERARLFEEMPLAQMKRRGWVPNTNDSDELREAVAEYRLEAVAAAARRGRSPLATEDWEPAHRAWFARVLFLAASIEVEAAFTQRRLQAAVEHLGELLQTVDQAREVPGVLSAAGIRFLVVEHLPSTKLDGATLWLSAREPVVALSMRFDRLDYFWHTLMHEIGHVRAGDGSLDDASSSPEEGTEELAREQAADEFAAEALIEQSVLSWLITRNGPRFSRASVMGFAEELCVHPSIVLGQLKHRELIPWRNLNALNESVRETVFNSVAVGDGWGTPAESWNRRRTITSEPLLPIPRHLPYNLRVGAGLGRPAPTQGESMTTLEQLTPEGRAHVQRVAEFHGMTEEEAHRLLTFGNEEFTFIATHGEGERFYMGKCAKVECDHAFPLSQTTPGTGPSAVPSSWPERSCPKCGAVHIFEELLSLNAVVIVRAIGYEGDPLIQRGQSQV